ncbi:M12 family metallo-peptidase [Nocardioides sp. AX2bis]|uniref:M12 family metallo-peptidase n=1 Tax=Nocardioides sp. AX2bis TaxID=2653157 RepID=UPI0012F02A56|nr:M12 family metallo-peptidase [Nocardioides sp. AX2bis]VXC58381.1 conserved exported hypothetical protein [Nocardioides sp. AX2bis]
MTLLVGTAQLTATPADAALPAAPAPAADPSGLWTAVAAGAADRATARMAAAADAEPRVEPRRSRAYTVDAAALDAALDRAPDEDSRAATTGAARISVPAPNGELVDFAVVESPVMEAGLAAAHPELRTFAGRGVDDPTASIRLDVTPMGFHASVLGPGGETAAWYVDPAVNGDDSLYLSYRGTDLPADQRGLVEPPEAAELHDEAAASAGARTAAAARAGEAPGEAVQRRTYRLALVTDPSYSTYFGPENVLAEKVTLMNRVNQIYNDDLAVRLLLVDGTEDLAFDTLAEATEPGGPCGVNACYTKAEITQGCGVELLFANRVALGQILGASAYDLGHVALGINGGGIAGLGVVGGKRKALGCTGLPQPEGDFMAIDYVAHEMGHQMGGPHTFNGTQVNCSGGNRSGGSSVEPGSGSSVMAYAGICGQDDLQPHTDPYFSQRSISDITGTVLAERSPADEVQQVSLAGFGTRGESFRLRYDGGTSRKVVRGTNYSKAGLKAVLDDLLAPSQVRVQGYGGDKKLGRTGFQVAVVKGPLSGTDVDLLEVVDPSSTVSGSAAETDRGGPLANGGDVVETPGNRAPAVEVPASATIPTGTPFTLTGGGSDVDGDALVYTWEQDDRGGESGTGLVDQTKTDGPLFRMFDSYAPVTPAGTLQYESPGENQATGDPSRTFPDLDQVLAGNTNAATGTCPRPPAVPTEGGSNVPIELRECFAEFLPTADYTGDRLTGNAQPSLTFRLTARDLDPQAGGTAYGDVRLRIDPTTGPFLVTGKNAEGAASVAGRTESLTWDVAGTRSLARQVRITLSTDGGQTYPTVLAGRVRNDGVQTVTWPDTPTEEGRIRIEAVGNYFFDVNDADLTILAAPGR